MKCYNLNCKERKECNRFKKMHCIFKITQRQKELVARISKGNCNDCGMKTVKARYKGRVARLCTGCGRVLQDGRVAEVCWVNSKRAV